jgi:hypothetical protein
VAKLRTNEGLHRTVELFKPYDGPASVDWSGPGSCAVTDRVDYADDVFVLRVPRSCLSQPRKVAFRSATRWWPTSDDVAYLDVSGTTGYQWPDWSDPLRRG